MGDGILPYGQKFDPLALNFRTISAGVPDLPANVAIVEADSYLEAIDKLVKAVRQAPVSFAVWNRNVPEDQQAYARNFMRDRQEGLLGMIDGGQAPYVTGYISGYFNGLVQAYDLVDMQRILHDNFRDELSAFVSAVQQKFPGRHIYPSLTRGIATDSHEFHLDGPADEHRDIGLIDETRLYYHPAIRFIVNYGGAPTAVAANDDIIFTREKALPHQPGMHYSAELRDTFNTVWEMEPWAVGIITNQRWPHPPAMHSGGITHEPGVRDSRLRMLLTVK